MGHRCRFITQYSNSCQAPKGKCWEGVIRDQRPWPDSGWSLMETVTGGMIYRHFYVRVPDGPHMGLNGFKGFIQRNKHNYAVRRLETSPN